MITTEPLADRRTALARRSPVAKFGAVAILSFALVSTVDPVAPAVALAATLATVPAFGISYRRLARRTWPIGVSVVGIVLATALFSATPGGQPLFWHVTTVTLGEGAALALRMLAVALPGILIFATTDPTDLADALVQQLRVPPRFAIGALAAFRLLPLFADEWRLLGLARRARGIEARGPWARIRLFAGTTFALLVAAIRRGVRLAVAMDARGFASGIARTNARLRPFTRADALVVLAGAAVAALALTVSVLTGAYRPLL